ncbi:CNNM domain-containing protein [Polycyclovorans algicola]|uniref:CNNM domain-containing protein n=1 Tax=Polycyclovorans algicola TaxID=616992 RepID=UPI0004A6E746|nr:hemolysin family protein [Polycyclovorans algicola]
MTLLIVFLLLALVISFACSMWEAVLLSVTPSYVTGAIAKGSTTGKLLAEFKKDIDRPLSAILTLNTTAHTVGAIGVGAQANVLFGSAGLDLFGLSLSFEAIIAGAATLAILVFSEIIPKTLGASYWQKFVPFTVTSLKVLIWVLYPLVRMSEGLTRLLKKDGDRPVFSRHDFLAMAEQGQNEGRLDDSETEVIRNLMAFRETTARAIMTPRTVVQAVRADTVISDFLARDDSATVSRLPVYRDEIGTVSGFVLRDDLLAAAARGEQTQPVSNYQREALFVLDRMHLPVLVKRLTQSRTHLAVVVDEYGVTQGVVTMEDVIETLLGLEIMDEADTVADMQALARERVGASQAGTP